MTANGRPRAIVGGGAGELGRRVSRRLAEEGYRVLALDRAPARESSPAVEHVQVDLTDEAAVVAITRREPPPRVVVNCQGWSPKDDAGLPIPEAQLSARAFADIVEANLLSCFLVMRELVPAMAAAGGGRVVNVSSTAALTGRTTASVAYAAAKAGLDALTRVFAVRYGAYGVLVCGVAPGKLEHTGSTDAPTTVDAYRKDIPVGRLARTDDLVEVIAFLASERNRHLTGSTVVVDGGRLA